MLVGYGLATNEECLVHPQDEPGIQRLLPWHAAAWFDVARQLFPDLADAGLLGRFTGLQLATRKLPASGEPPRGSSTCGKQPSAVHDRSSHDE
jgi:hypothetical protein